MTETIMIGNLCVDRKLAEFIANEVAPGTGRNIDQFWVGYQALLHDLEPENKKLLAERNEFQARIDDWNRARAGKPFDVSEQRSFLEEIGYIAPESADFAIETTDVDPEIALLAGPQLVVPVMNARFALNAANARWGSLYDALYGTDAIPETCGMEKGIGYNSVRGDKVVAWVRTFLDRSVPLGGVSWSEITSLVVIEGKLAAAVNDRTVYLANAVHFVGYLGHPGKPTSLILKNNGLHIEILIDPTTLIGRRDPASISDVWLESALTTIQDCEDSVAAVDAADKIVVYRNWLGLMKGDLQEEVTKNGKTFIRKLSADRNFTAPGRENLVLPGRSLMLVRNVGHLMTTDAVRHENGSETPEGFLDAMVTTFCALHDRDTGRNSRRNSIYIVKPKMHGPKEAALTNAIFDRVEDILELPRHTIKVGVMDEERRTSVNLKETIRAVKGRLAFINTGFLDRTGDEIHTNMLAGPVVPKNDIKSTCWLGAYENNNVDVGLETGLAGRAQIGKGMWAKPDAMTEMLDVKIGHPKSGANTAWVPSPTAATLHATHYHGVDVAETQQSIIERANAKLDDILTPPLLAGRNLSEEEVRRELDNNAQSLLAYVVRWIDQGIGCSKVPDIDDVALMEDRATLRISAQHITNWLKHGICKAEQVEETLARMAGVVDRQNASDPLYQPMSPNFDGSIAFQAARELVFEGLNQPNGYTEPILHRRRREAKKRSAS